MGAARGVLGTCKLTGDNGVYVKSHLIPRAVNRLTRTGEKAIEHGLDVRKAVRRPEGWYDTRLVTDSGERILQKYDDEGLRELRAIGLLASFPLPKGTETYFDQTSGHRLFRVSSAKPQALRMFALSLLWRAAHTSIEQFSTYRPNNKDSQYLTKLVQEGKAGLPSEFVTIFTKLLGPIATHNRTPLRERAEFDGIQADYTRFYFDGMVIHIYDREVPREIVAGVAEGIVGFQNDFSVVAIPFAESREKENLQLVSRDLIRNGNG